jgi:hypothetical protein
MFPPGRSPQSDLFEFEHPNQLANPLLQRFEIWGIQAILKLVKEPSRIQAVN